MVLYWQEYVHSNVLHQLSGSCIYTNNKHPNWQIFIKGDNNYRSIKHLGACLGSWQEYKQGIIVPEGPVFSLYLTKLHELKQTQDVTAPL